jgi:hypothetical protein
MPWRIALEVVFVLIVFFAGVNFWACSKTPKHLYRLLGDSEELSRLIDHFGYERLLADAQGVAPQAGTFDTNISILNIAHYKSLSLTRNTLLFVVLVVLAASGWLGFWYFVVSLLVFVALGFTDIPDSAKNNNANHVASVTLNLMKWRQEDERACQVFCCYEHPEYRTLYQLLRAAKVSEYEMGESQ